MPLRRAITRRLLSIFAVVSLATSAARRPHRPCPVSLWRPSGWVTHYDEPGFDVNADEQLYSVGVGYTHKFYGAWFLRVRARYTQGEGQLEIPNRGTAGGIDQRIWEGSIEWGRDMGFEGALSIAPFIGIGYRRWNDDAGGAVTSGGGFGFDREVDYLYIPIGVTTFWALGDAWTVALRTEFRYLLDGREKGQLSDIPGVSFDLNNDFDTGRGLVGELLVRKRFSNDLAVAFGPFIRYWDIEESEVDANVALVVPENETIEGGLTFKFIIGPPL